MIGVITLLAAIQTAAPAVPMVPPPPPVVVMPPAPLPAPDAAKVAAADKLLITMQVERQYETIFGQMIPVMAAQLTTQLRDNTTVPPAIRARLSEDAGRDSFRSTLAVEVTKQFRSRFGEMRHLTAIEYARDFTVDELEGLNAFYQSPLGQKALTALPQLQTRLMPIGMRVGMEAGRAAMETTIKQLMADGAKPPRT